MLVLKDMILKGRYMRLDRFLCEANMGTRSQVKQYVRQGLVTVNGEVARNADRKINEHADAVCLSGKRISYRPFVYYMLNKPEGVVSATRDNTAGTVVSLLGSKARDGVFPVGRLDKDTTGLLLLTNDGELAHRLLSPKRHVDKTYLVTVGHELSSQDMQMLRDGVDIGDEKPTLPAKAETLSPREIALTIHEGRFHQVKRMLQAVGNEVLALKRVSFGSLRLDEGLLPGEYRELTPKEVEGLHGA